MQQTRRYIFNHIPKTGGTSLLAVLRNYFRTEEISPHLADLHIRYRNPAHFERYRLITGHFSLLTQMEFCRNRYSITMLRDPIKRIISTYTFYRIATEGGPLKEKARELSFGEFVRYFQESPTVLHNSYCHHFGALADDLPGFPSDTDELLAVAKHNLAAFNFVGISEEFTESVRLLCQALGWRAPSEIPHENRSASEVTIPEIDSETMQLLYVRNKLDIELYEYARSRFSQYRNAVEADTSNGACIDREPNHFVPSAVSRVTERKARILSVSAEWQQGSTMELCVDFSVTAAVGEMSLGVAIADASGSIIWGINTSDAGLPLRHGTGFRTRAKFLLECDLPVGTYIATVALSDKRKIGFHEHWIDHAAQFSIEPHPATESRKFYSIRLLDFESAASPESISELASPRRNSDAQQMQLVNANATDSNLELNLPVTVDRTPSAIQPNAFAVHAVIDADTKISNPKVRLQLARTQSDEHSSNRKRLYVTVSNLGDEPLSSHFTFPVKLSYHWMTEDGTVRQHDGLRSNLLSDVLPADSSTHEVVIGQPPDERCTLLCVTLVQEDVCWFDERDPENRLLVRLQDLMAGTP